MDWHDRLGGLGNQQLLSVHLKELPDGLKRLWQITKLDMTDQSRCAAAFDGYGDPDKMTLRRSVHIRMAAEGT